MNVCSSIKPNITIVDEITEIIDKRWPTAQLITVQNQVHTVIVIIAKVKGLENMLLEIDHRHELAYLDLIINYYQIVAADKV